MVKFPPPLALAAAVGLAVLLTSAARPLPAAAIQDYIALGDSMAFGETDFTHNPSYGDRGYVKPFADYLGAQNGGVRPGVINLAVDAETSSTFFNGGPPGDGTVSGKPAPQLNLNYPTHPPTPTQNALLLSTIASEQALGHQIGTVSLQLGANDLFVTVNNPGFFNLPAAQQQDKIVKALATIQTNETTLLTELKTKLPNANLVLLGYHNPFNADPTSPIGKIADPAIKALNTLIAGEAAAFGARYIDTYTPIFGHELQYTFIASGNVHPNDLGYAAIANQFTVTTVPEPTSLFVMGVGLCGWLALGRRRSSRTA